jgi:chromosome partitioning protein
VGARKAGGVVAPAAVPGTGQDAPKSRSRRGRPPKPGTRATRVIAVANQKGGVGKSTTAVSLGAALAEIGYRVLVVDLDPQGNASTGLGLRHEGREVTVYDILAAEAPVDGAIVQTPVANLWAIPSTIDLAGAEIELVSQFSRELRLRKALEPVRERSFDFVFLDCPPSLGLLTVNALAAAEELLVPIQCEYYALEGLGQLLRNVRLVQQNVNPSLHLAGIVMTMFDPRTRLSEQVVAEVRKFFGDRVYATIIPRTVRLSEAPGFGQPITVYDPRSKGAESYRELAREVASRRPKDEPLPTVEDLPAMVVVPPEPHVMSAPRPLRPLPLEEEEELALEEAPAPEGEEEAGLVETVPTVEAPTEAEGLTPPAFDAQTVVEGETRDALVLIANEEDEGIEAAPEANVASIPEQEVTVPGAGETRGTPGPPERVEPVETGVAAGADRAEDVAGSPREVEPESEVEEEPHKRRWRLFRRGGSS